MLYSPPKFSYCGLTIILSNVSRFDKLELLSAIAGYKYNKECLAPELNRFQCDIRLAEDARPLLSNTKCLLLLGQRSLSLHTDSSLTLNEVRGTPLYSKSELPCIASYFPQDCMDIRDYESEFNTESKAEEFEEDSEPEFVGDKKRSKTQRQNFFFWLKEDTKRAIQVIQNNGIFPKDEIEPIYEIYPNISNIIKLLYETKNSYLYLDIETDGEFNIRCIGLSFNGIKIYVIPLLTYTYEPAYSLEDMCRLYKALCIAFRDNILVAHNGLVFDFFIFCWKYKIPVGRRLEDTMLLHGRCWTEAEKSLAHCMSHLTWQPYHKDEGVHTYTTADQSNKLWQYCAKDVFGLALIHKALWKQTESLPGLKESYEQVNASLYPYLLMSLQGICYDKSLLESKLLYNDRYATQMLRIMQILHGKEVPALISNKKCVNYFHDQLKYKVQLRSKRTMKPSLNEKALLKLRLNYKNPVIDCLLNYRRVLKESGVMKFNDWKLNENRGC